MCRALLQDLGLVVGKDVRLEINSLGQPDERSAHRAGLIAYLEQHADALDEDSRRRLYSNPLRILDSKNPAMQAIADGAPRLMDFLGAASLGHFAAVRAVLDAAGLDYRVNPRLVRGLDYYNLTVFEWVTDRLGAQGAVCGGGRYDGMFEQLGGKRTPAVGWGMGIERMLLLLEAAGVAMPAAQVDVYAIVPGPEALPVAMVTCEALRAAGLTVQMHAAGAEGPGSMKAQFKKADASGARFALVFGADEVARGAVGLKNLKNASTPQITPSLSPTEVLVSHIKSATPQPS
jgi:histidyl-tRNA synthetase